MSEEDKKKENKAIPLDEKDISLLKRYGMGPYSEQLKSMSEQNNDLVKQINTLCGIKESNTGLALPSLWNLEGDKVLFSEHPLQVARCTKIINPRTDNAKYMINIKQMAKYVVGLGEKVADTDIEEGMRVGVDRQKYSIQLPLPPKIDPTVTMMTVEERPDVTYNDIGGAKE
jgi:26S proteasome regulatory subunit T1